MGASILIPLISLELEVPASLFCNFSRTRYVSSRRYNTSQNNYATTFGDNDIGVKNNEISTLFFSYLF